VAVALALDEVDEEELVELAEDAVVELALDVVEPDDVDTDEDDADADVDDPDADTDDEEPVLDVPLVVPEEVEAPVLEAVGEGVLLVSARPWMAMSRVGMIIVVGEKEKLLCGAAERRAWPIFIQLERLYVQSGRS